jgi:adenylyltransferase/sulfurtransferase
MEANKEEQRYDRQIMIPEIGVAGQALFATKSILVIGAGGLGSPALLYLAGAGIGRLGLVEFDCVSPSNLNRQILYKANQIGEEKVHITVAQLQAFNPEIEFQYYPMALDAQNAQAIMSGYDLVLDCSDNFATRFIINDAATAINATVVYAAVYKFQGQITVFGPTTKRLRDLYPEAPVPNTAPDAKGIIGATAGILGSMQATEALKILLGIGTPLYNKLLTVNLLTNHFQIISL